MNHKYLTKKGLTSPLGASHSKKTTNFAIFSENATAITLALFTPHCLYPFLEIELDPKEHKTGSVWHVAVENLPDHVIYSYRAKGPCDPSKGLIFNDKLFLLDPYAKGVDTSHIWGDGFAKEYIYAPKGKVVKEMSFDWQNTKPPRINEEDLVIYEAHVRGFTCHKSSGVKHPGTFLGLIEKIPYLKSLGVNAIELLPIFEFDECENKKRNPITNRRLHNFWGYSTVNFFTPMNRYASSSDYEASIIEFKTLVRELHKNNMELILDVVYNHTSEGGSTGPTQSFKGLDNPTYYILTPGGEYYNFSGTGNTFNCNHPIVKKLIVDSLRYWAIEMQVDGFRFDLASILTRGPDGAPLENPPVIQEIIRDSDMKGTKWIAEAWDAAGLYQVGSFPGDGQWYEWNGKFRDIARKFIKGTDHQVGAFASSICGSQDLYGKDRSPFHSINFITAHDGYSLYDLVSYQDKHNLENGEENKDGANDNESWNCGAEGETKNPAIVQLRERQMKNFMCTLFLSAGTPMLLMGDEYGHTRKGNNNPYCQDSELNYFLWDELDKHPHRLEFIKALIQFRAKHKELFCRKEFLSNADITWHGCKPKQPDWSEKSRFIALTLHDPSGHDIYIAYNASFDPVTIELPQADLHRHWHKVIDTYANWPNSFIEKPEKHHREKEHLKMHPYSVIVLKAL